MCISGETASIKPPPFLNRNRLFVLIPSNFPQTLTTDRFFSRKNSLVCAWTSNAYPFASMIGDKVCFISLPCGNQKTEEKSLRNHKKIRIFGSMFFVLADPFYLRRAGYASIQTGGFTGRIPGGYGTIISCRDFFLSGA